MNLTFCKPAFLFLLSFQYLAFAQTHESNDNSDMILVNGGEVTIGNNEGNADEKPSFQAHINSFLLDSKPVTVSQFRLFLRLSGYITDAEKLGSAFIFNDSTQTWEKVKGANWEYPLGKQQAKAKSSDPVSQISWNDAKAYANWTGKRLPTEFEMEYALKNASHFKIHFADKAIWYWCDNWYTKYNEDSYFKKNLNRKKTLKGGLMASAKHQPLKLNPAARNSAAPEVSQFNFGLICAKDPNE